MAWLRLAGRGKLLCCAILLLVTFTVFLTHTRGISFPISGSRRRPSQGHEPSDWWVEFFTRLESTRVQAAPVRIEGKARADNWKPDVDYERPDLLQLSDRDFAYFRASHEAFMEQLPLFARHLPYEANTTGIVTTAGKGSFGQALSLTLMTRQTGSSLPIQIVLDSSAPWIDELCTNTLPSLNATCIYTDDIWVGLESFNIKFERFQWKFISIIASTYQNVLFLDADCLPVFKPDTIFEPGAEPFTSFGFITWPDFWTQSASRKFYKIAGDVEVPALQSRATSESGVMVYDKARHADTLLLAAYYNFNGPDHFYAMFTQHGPGEGDKESFLAAAVVLDGLKRKQLYKEPTEWMKPGLGLKKGHWDIKILPRVHGRSAKGSWRGMFMQQMDPMEDYRVVMDAIEKAKKNPAKTDQGKRGDIFGRGVPRNAPSSAGSLRVEDYLTDSSFLETVGKLKMEHNHDRFMFFHHNGVKPDFTRIHDPKSGITETNEQGTNIRMWGDPDWIINRIGRDVEKLLWKDSLDIYCRTDLVKVCEEMRRIYDVVYQPS
ncbi:mannosyltransferase putative-domain-containing protein [Podospora australis]|uniref:Mannosyltransferase putative-domain-containing protein n=1 Tax=Podospora australis TaxID=1536484 RepID=A0AAN6WMS6_9PEZI|nr:mannosyltransferase putative-domain-containing protein [Podospora australis]